METENSSRRPAGFRFYYPQDSLDGPGYRLNKGGSPVAARGLASTSYLAGQPAGIVGSFPSAAISWLFFNLLTLTALIGSVQDI